MATRSMTSLLSQLRQACDDQHQALHIHPLLEPLDRGAITLDRYKAILAMFYAAYEQTEQHKPRNGLPDSPVIEWLKADMHAHAVPPLGWSSPALKLDTDSKLIGYLYVKQGSTLGGQRISKHLQDALSLGPADNQFFYGYGDKTGARWRRFKDKLESIEDSLQHDEVIATAQSAFGAIRACADRIVQETA